MRVRYGGSFAIHSLVLIVIFSITSALPIFLFAKETHSSVSADAVVKETNAERSKASVTVLQVNEKLTAAAEAKVKDMATRGYFSHNSPGGVSPWKWIRSEGYLFSRAGENLAVRFSDPHAIVVAWLASPRHRDNLLDPLFTDVGVGVAEGVYKGSTTTFVVQLFATSVEREGGRAAATAAAAEVSPFVTSPPVEGDDGMSNSSRAEDSESLLSRFIDFVKEIIKRLVIVLQE